MTGPTGPAARPTGPAARPTGNAPRSTRSAPARPTPAARAAWYRRFGIEARNVVLTTLLALLLLALVIGAVVLITALAVG